jgi:Fur family ferric uptake transcriptional regulator
VEEQPVSPQPEGPLAILRKHLKASRLKQTAQREVVLHCLLEGPRYATLDEIVAAVQKRQRRIGVSTVYRCMKLFCECGLAKEHHFLYGRTCFEHSLDAAPHDYLVCKRCGKVQEFSNPLIQAVQEKVSKELDFKLQEHRVELYGICSACQGPAASRPEEE